jgi:DNA-binding HxlR family transcriptional regulator
MKEVGLQKETIAENQTDRVQKKLKKIFGHLDPSHPPEICPIRDILSPVSDKWSILIVLFLGGSRVLRFNQLKTLLYGVSSKSLAERLKHLEKDGYIQRTLFPEVPIRVEYQLTSFGYSYLNKLLDLTEWISLSMPEVIKKRHQFDLVFENKTKPEK